MCKTLQGGVHEASVPPIRYETVRKKCGMTARTYIFPSPRVPGTIGFKAVESDAADVREMVFPIAFNAFCAVMLLVAVGEAEDMRLKNESEELNIGGGTSLCCAFVLSAASSTIQCCRWSINSTTNASPASTLLSSRVTFPGSSRCALPSMKWGVTWSDSKWLSAEESKHQTRNIGLV